MSPLKSTPEWTDASKLCSSKETRRHVVEMSPGHNPWVKEKKVKGNAGFCS